MLRFKIKMVRIPSMKKLYITDLDGTLLNQNASISPYSEQVIKKIIKNNNISGNYQINIYTNDIYGMIIEFNKIKENSYIDLKINITIDSIFLYKTNNNYLNNNNTIYYYKNNYYILPKNNNINLLEVEEVLYGNIVKEILAKGIKVSI